MKSTLLKATILCVALASTTLGESESTSVSFNFVHTDNGAGAIEAPVDPDYQVVARFTVPGEGFVLGGDKVVYQVPEDNLAFYGDEKRLSVLIREGDTYWFAFANEHPIRDAMESNGIFEFVPPEWAAKIIFDGHTTTPIIYEHISGSGYWYCTSGVYPPFEHNLVYWMIRNPRDPQTGGVNSIQILSSCGSCPTCPSSNDGELRIDQQDFGNISLSSNLPFSKKCCGDSSSARITWLPPSLEAATDPFSIRATSGDSETSYALANATAYRFPRSIDQPIQQVKVGELLGVVVTGTNTLTWRFYDATGIGEPSAAGEYPLSKTDNSPLLLLEEVTITQENAASVLYERRVGGTLVNQSRLTHDAVQNLWENENILAGSRGKLIKAASGTGWLTSSEYFEKNSSGIWKLVRTNSSTTETINGIEVVVQESSGGEIVSTYGYDATGRKLWAQYGDGSWDFFEYVSSTVSAYRPYGDTPFPGVDWIPALSDLTGIRCDYHSQSSTERTIGVASIGLVSVGAHYQSSSASGNYDETSESSGPHGTTRTTVIKKSDFVFKGFRGKVLLEDDGRGQITLHEYTRGTIDSNGFSPNANGTEVMEIVTTGASNANVPDLQLYDSDYLILHPITVGASFPDVVTRDVRVYDAKGRTVCTATQVLDGTGYAVATQTVWTYSTLPDGEGEVVIETRDGRVVSETSSLNSGTWVQNVDVAGIARITERDLLGRVTSETMPGDNGGTITRSYAYDGLTTTVTTLGGGLSLVTSETRDLRGRIVSTTDEVGIITGYTYTDGGRTTTTTRPGNINVVTTNYLDGRFKQRSGTGVIRTFASYAIDASGNEVTIQSIGPAVSGNHGARWIETTTDIQGRTVSVRRPGPPNESGGRQPDVTESYSYDPTTGNLTSIASSARPGLYRLMQQNLLGTWSATGTATHTGPLIAASIDRFSTSETTYEKRNGQFWRVTTQNTYVNGPTPVTASSAFRLWTGEGEASEYTDAANVTTTRTTIYNRATQTVVITSGNPLHGTTTETTVNGFLKTRTVPGATQNESFGYDGLGRLISHTDVRNATTRNIYNNLGQVEKVVDHVGQSAAYEYYPSIHHSAGLVHTTIDSAGKVIETIYDYLARVASVRGNAAYPLDFSYNEFGEMETLTTYGTQTAVTTWVIDPPSGLLLEKKYHGQSSGVKSTYYGDGKLASRTWRRGIRTDYGYSSFGDLDSVTYPDGTPDVSLSNFDRLGRPGTVTEGGSTTTLSYNSPTGETSTTYPAGHGVLPGLSIVMKEPDSGRPGGYTLNQGGTERQNVIYGYDTSSRFGEITSSGHQIGYQYYPGTGILRETTHTVAGGGTPRIESRHIDLAGRAFGVITTVPNGTGRRIAASAGYVLNERGLRTRLTREDGTTWTFGYNDRIEVTSGVKKLANNNLAAGLQFGYQYDGIGNRQWAKSGGDSSGQNQRTVQYTPNALNQYSEISTPGSFDVLVRSQDPVGVSVNGTSLDVSTQETFHRAEATAVNPDGAWTALNITSPVGQNSISGHRWLPPATFSPVHDDDGNLTNDGRWIYTWDAENRLTSQTTTALAAAAGVPRGKVENTYDWQSRRIQKKVSMSSNGTTWNLVSDERFIYNGWNPAAVFNASGGTLTVKQTCLWGLDLSGTLQGAGGVGGLLLISDHSPSITDLYPAFDGNGNIIAWNATNGETLQRMDYDPFGNAVTKEGVTGFEAPAWGFSTKYQDRETGLLYYGYRYYDPVTGRWPSRDPIGERGGVNLYGFVGNDGINKNDKLGLAPSFWDQTIFGPGGGCAHEDKVETSWFEHNFASDVEEWKQWARNTVTEAFSCSNRGRDIGSRDGYKYTLIPTRLPKREVYPWPQNRWSQIAQLGTAYLELLPSAIKWKIDAYPAPIGKGCCDTFSWSVTIQLRDGLGWDKGDGPVYYILGDGNPMFCGSGTRSPFPDRDIKRGEWKIYGTGACCDYKL